MLQLPHEELYVDPQNPDFRCLIYGDDTHNMKRMRWRRNGGEVVFYAIPEVPRIRMTTDANGATKPVFLLTKYKFSDEDRNTNPDLPKGGGFLLFDVELGMSAEEKKNLLAHLQKRVEDAHYQRHGGRPAEGEEAATEYRGPRARLAVPEYTDGNVTFYLVDDPNLVKGHINEKPASLIGSNVAIFNASLTPAGATYMEKTLVDPGGEGGTDLANVQVRYDLKFWARLPPAKIRAFGRARNIHRAVSGVWHNYEGRGCNEDISATWEQHYEYNSSMQAMTISIDTGAYEVDDEGIKELRQFVISQAMEWIRNNLLTKLEPTDPGFPDLDDIYGSKEDVYRLKRIEEVTRDTFRLNLSQTSIIEKQLFPQATLKTCFKGMSAQEMQEFVRTVDLNDPFFSKVRPTVRAFAKWDYGTIKFVTVDIDYKGDVQSFHFDPEDLNAKSYEWSLQDNDRGYRYRYTVGFAGDRPAFQSEWKTDTTRELSIAIPETGRIDVEVKAGDIDWGNIVKQAQIELTYADHQHGVPEESFTVTLTKDAPNEGYLRDVYAPVRRPLRYKTKFFLQNEAEVEGESGETNDRRIVINDPIVRKVEASFQTAGAWEIIRQVTVNVRYHDTAGSDVAPDPGTFLFTSGEDFHQWRALLDDSAPNTPQFQYRYSVLYKDGDVEPHEVDWSEPQDTGSTITLTWPSPPLLTVTVRPHPATKWDVTSAIEVTLKNSRLEPNEDPTFSAYFDASEKAPQKWIAVLADNDPSSQTYAWTVTYYLATGDTIVKEGSKEGDFFVVPLYVPPPTPSTPPTPPADPNG